MSADYVELRAHSWYSFGGGVPAPAVLAQHAASLEYPALGLTDAANLCGALEFAQACETAGVRPLFGVDLPVRDGDRAGPVTLLAADGDGYANICRLASLVHLTGGGAGRRNWTAVSWVNTPAALLPCRAHRTACWPA